MRARSERVGTRGPPHRKGRRGPARRARLPPPRGGVDNVAGQAPPPRRRRLLVSPSPVSVRRTTPLGECHDAAYRIPPADPRERHGGTPGGGAAHGAGRTRRGARLRFGLGGRLAPRPPAARADHAARRRGGTPEAGVTGPRGAPAAPAHPRPE